MKIGIQYAMPVEFHSLPGMKEKEPFATISGIPFYEVEDGIIAACGGIGKVNAAMCAQILCRHFACDLILNAGVAGGMEDLPTGTLVLATDFVQHDMDTSAIGDPVGFVSTVDRLDFPTWNPEQCAELLREDGLDVQLGRVATGDWFATNCPRAEFIRDTFHPALVEMEGGAIAHVCARNGVRFVALKSVSDRLFSADQMSEYFDFGKAIEKLGRVVLPLAEKLQKLEG